MIHDNLITFQLSQSPYKLNSMNAVLHLHCNLIKSNGALVAMVISTNIDQYGSSQSNNEPLIWLEMQGGYCNKLNQFQV